MEGKNMNNSINQDGMSAREIAEIICSMNHGISASDPTRGPDRKQVTNASSLRVKQGIDSFLEQQELQSIDSGENSIHGIYMSRPSDKMSSGVKSKNNNWATFCVSSKTTPAGNR